MGNVRAIEVGPKGYDYDTTIYAIHNGVEYRIYKFDYILDSREKKMVTPAESEEARINEQKAREILSTFKFIGPAP